MKRFPFSANNFASVKIRPGNISKYSNTIINAKIDSGAAIFVMPYAHFKYFFHHKLLENGKEIEMCSASNHSLTGYIHQVPIFMPQIQANFNAEVCFYSGSRTLIGIDILKKYFHFCINKQGFSLEFTP